MIKYRNSIDIHLLFVTRLSLMSKQRQDEGIGKKRIHSAATSQKGLVEW